MPLARFFRAIKKQQALKTPAATQIFILQGDSYFLISFS